LGVGSSRYGSKNITGGLEVKVIVSSSAFEKEK